MLQLTQKLVKVQYRPSIFDSAGFFKIQLGYLAQKCSQSGQDQGQCPQDQDRDCPEVVLKWSRPKPRLRPRTVFQDRDCPKVHSKWLRPVSPRPRLGLPRSGLEVVKTKAKAQGGRQHWT